MANRVPLVVDTSTLYIKELPSGDNLDLTGSGIVGLTGIGGTNGNFTGIVTASAYYIDSNEVISNGRSLRNITSIQVSGISTLGVTSATNLTSQQLNVSGIATIATASIVGAALSTLAVSGISTLAIVDINGGDIEVSNVDTVDLNVTGISTLGTVRISSGIITATSGIVTYFGDGNFLNLTSNSSRGIGIGTTGGVVGYGVTFIDFKGAGVSTTFYNSSVGIATIFFEGGGGGGVTELKTIVSTTSSTGVGSFAVATHRSADVIAQITQGSNYQVGRYLMIHNGSTVTIVEESSIATGSMLGSFDGVVNGSNAELRVTMVSAGIATITTKIDKVSIP